MNTDPITSIIAWFDSAIPEPTDKNRRVQVGVFLEEVAETLSACKLGMYARTVDSFANSLKFATIDLPDVERIKLLDGLCDVIVTVVGIAHNYNLDIMGALDEVDRSNWSKFIDGKPLFNEQGKIVKSAGYTPPDLTPFV